MMTKLIDGEHVLIRTKQKGPAILTGALLKYILITILAATPLGWLSATAARHDPHLSPWVPIAVVLLELLLTVLLIKYSITPLLHWNSTRITLTNHRLLYRKTHTLNRTTQIPLTWIHATQTTQSPWQRVWNCGNLEIQTTNGQPLTISAIPNPEKFHYILNNAIQNS